MLKILLADAHAVVRRSVKQILAETFAQATFGEAQNVQELLQLIGGEHWDITRFRIPCVGQTLTADIIIALHANQPHADNPWRSKTI